MLPSIVSILNILCLLLSTSFAAPLRRRGNETSSSGSNGSILASLTKVSATQATPSSAAEAVSRVSSVLGTKPTPANIYEAAGDLVEAGVTSQNVDEVVNFVKGLLDGDNSESNVNLKNPNPAAYPKASSEDAPYDVSEAKLRAAIHIPSTFKYGANGAPNPAILVPGTGETGYTTFVGNYIPLLQNSDIADPVWLNIPGYLLNDAQTNAEYVAYAVNYIYGISNHRNVSVITWSQGGLDAQWAFKYWPSTNSRVSDLIAFSPDFHGTVEAYFTALGEPEPPSIFQQEYNSNFITTLRSNGGDSAYVPTTTVYSGFFDEVVEPQQGTGASAFLNDARNIGVSNNEVQTVCAGQPAGSFYGHEGTLYNPLGYALAVDALTHDGPGESSRLDLGSVCADYLTPGLDIADFLLTENTIVVASVAVLLYQDGVTQEPPIKPYAQS